MMHLFIKSASIFTLVLIGGVFALFGVLLSVSRARLVYLLALIVASYIIVTAIKLARRKQIEAEVAAK